VEREEELKRTVFHRFLVTTHREGARASANARCLAKAMNPANTTFASHPRVRHQSPARRQHAHETPDGRDAARATPSGSNPNKARRGPMSSAATIGLRAVKPRE